MRLICSYFSFLFVNQLHLYSRMVRSTLYISLWWLCRRKSGSVCSRLVHWFRQSQSQWGDSKWCVFIYFQYSSLGQRITQKWM